MKANRILVPGHPARWFVVAALCLFGAACARSTATEVLLTGNTMGTTYSVKLVQGPSATIDQALLQQRIDQQLLEINQQMSTYIADSELNRLNRMPVGEPFEVSPAVLQMLALAKRLYLLSEYHFDVTVGPLVNLWGFGPDPRQTEVPDPALIKAVRERVGMHYLEVDGAQVTRKADISIDLSAIAKGYGVDELARLVEEAGVRDYLVEIGGELRARGRNSQGNAWYIGIETPVSSKRIPLLALPLRDLSMATSGDYRNYFEVDGKRYSHTIDPTTGYPIQHAVVSVTVLAPTAALADGMATAINVMGQKAGLAMANEQNLPVLVIIRRDEEFVELHSNALKHYLAETGS